MPKPVHHRCSNRNDVCRKDARQGKDNRRLHKTRVDAREKRFERDRKAENECYSKRENTSKRGQAKTASPHAFQLFQIIFILSAKADPAILERQRRCRLPHRHKVHELANTCKSTRRQEHRQKLVHYKNAQGVEERHHSRTHKRLPKIHRLRICLIFPRTH